MASTKSMNISVKAPRGTKPGDTVVKKAQAAAQAVMNEYGPLYAAVAGLSARGISITVEELLSRRGAKSTGPRKAKATRKKAGRKKAARKKVARKTAAPKAAAPKTKAAPKKAKRKSRRTVLTTEQRQSLTDRLKAGATAAKAAAEFGVSTATVNNIKRAAGLTKPRDKQAKAPAKD